MKEAKVWSGHDLRRRRDKARLSRADLAKMSNTSVGAIARWENEDKPPARAAVREDIMAALPFEADPSMPPPAAPPSTPTVKPMPADPVPPAPKTKKPRVDYFRWLSNHEAFGDKPDLAGFANILAQTSPTRELLDEAHQLAKRIVTHDTRNPPTHSQLRVTMKRLLRGQEFLVPTSSGELEPIKLNLR